MKGERFSVDFTSNGLKTLFKSVCRLVKGERFSVDFTSNELTTLFKSVCMLDSYNVNLLDTGQYEDEIEKNCLVAELIELHRIKGRLHNIIEELLIEEVGNILHGKERKK